ncbi:MAG: hypothetical protein WC677_03490 [Clostridia bacterium]
MNDFQKSLKEILKEKLEYINSEECRNECLSYEKRRRELISFADKYKDKFDNLSNMIKEKTIRTEYSVGGTSLHRGFYCPSPIEDIIVGNVNRGRLTKNCEKKDFEYYFDNSGILIGTALINEYNNGETEYITATDGIELGIIFDDFSGLRGVSKCIFRDNKISKYEYASVLSNDLTTEIYGYDESNCLSSVEKYSNFVFEANILSHENYIFFHDEKGYLSKFRCVEYLGKKTIKSIYEDPYSKVTVKRKA